MSVMAEPSAVTAYACMPTSFLSGSDRRVPGYRAAAEAPVCRFGTPRGAGRCARLRTTGVRAGKRGAHVEIPHRQPGDRRADRGVPDGYRRADRTGAGAGRSRLPALALVGSRQARRRVAPDRKSTRLNSSHVKISYAVFRLQQKAQRLEAQLG